MEIDLSRNKFTSIPAAVTTLPLLHTLDFRKNNIGRLHVLYVLLRCPALTSVTVAGNPINDQGQLCEKVLKVRDTQLLELIRALEARKDFRQENALNLMVLGDGEAGER